MPYSWSRQSTKEPQQIKCNVGIKRDQNIKENVIRAKLGKHTVVLAGEETPFGGNKYNK